MLTLNVGSFQFLLKTEKNQFQAKLLRYLVHLIVKLVDMNNTGAKKCNLLVVDDDEDLLILFWAAMRAKGYQVEVSKNAETFWDDLYSTKPDVIILDIHMMGIDGSKLCRELKSHENTSKIPVILLSGNEDIETIAIQSGANGFIRKPFNAAKVEQEVGRLLH